MAENPGTMNVGSLFGFPLFLHWSFYVAMLMVSLLDGISGMILVGLYFISLFVHELGHAVVCRRYGKTVDITIGAIGGFVRMHDRLEPKQELVVALAGPAATVVMAALSMFIWQCSDVDCFKHVACANAIFCGLNLIPLYPLDGGLALMSIFRMRGYDADYSTKIVCSATRILAAILGAGALYMNQIGIVMICVLSIVICSTFIAHLESKALENPVLEQEVSP